MGLPSDRDRSDRGEASSPDDLLTIQEPRAQRALVWIVDDTPLEIEMARRVLAPHYDLATFPDGATMLERLAEGASPDILVLDWQLPGMSGIEVCRFLRGTTDQITLPILMLTVFGHKQDIVEGLAAGANDYVTKPYDPAELLARVGTLVRTHQLYLRLEEAETICRLERHRLAQSQLRLQILNEAIPQIVWTAGPDGRLDHVNRRWREYTGLTLAEARDFGGVGPLIHPDEEARLRERWGRSVRTGEIYDFPFRLRRADGVYHWFLGRALPVRDEGGQITQWFGTLTDIDEHKRAEQALELLARAGAALVAGLDSAAAAESIARIAVPVLADWCGVYLRDGDAMRLANDAHVDAPESLRALAASHPLLPDAPSGAPTILRSRDPVLFPDVGRALEAARGADAALLESLREAGVTSWMTVPLALQNRTFGCIACALVGPGRAYDAADLALAEELGRRTALAIDNARLFEMTQRERARVEEANHAKDEFLATVSHELRTPLNAILGWTVMLRSGPMTEERRARAIETIERNARSQTQLIEDLLDISRIISGKLRLSLSPVMPLSIVEAAIDTVRPAAEAKNVRLQAALDSHVGPIMGDPERLQQVVWNLLTNAIKFTPKGGRVHVQLRREGSDLEIAVADTGRGIPPEFLPYVFERFRQADMGIARSHGGLGLGLAITRHLIELHGGAIRAQSPGEGLGATFIIRIPLAPLSSMSVKRAGDDASGVDPSASLVCPPEIEGIRVLVVDDEEDARELMASVLEGCKAKVRTAASASEALELVRQDPPDVLVSDVGMPGESGYELISRVRRLPPEQGGRTPAVALTAYARMEDRTRALMMGFDMHLPKPIEPSELLIVIAHLASRFLKT